MSEQGREGASERQSSARSPAKERGTSATTPLTRSALLVVLRRCGEPTMSDAPSAARRPVQSALAERVSRSEMSTPGGPASRSPDAAKLRAAASSAAVLRVGTSHTRPARRRSRRRFARPGKMAGRCALLCTTRRTRSRCGLSGRTFSHGPSGSPGRRRAPLAAAQPRRLGHEEAENLSLWKPGLRSESLHWHPKYWHPLTLAEPDGLVR